MDARNSNYIQELTKMIADLRQESYKQLQRIETLEKDGVAIRLNPGVTIQGPAILRTSIRSEQQPQQLAGTDHAGWHRLSDVEPLNGAQCLFRVHPSPLHSRGVWVDQSHSLTPSISPSGFYTDRGLFVGDPALIWWSAIEPEAQQPAPATEDSSATAPPAPAGGLVERLSHLLAKRFSKSRPGTDCTSFACDAIREVAAWLEQQQEVPVGSASASADYFAAMLRSEANR